MNIKKEQEYDWDNSPVICQLDGFEYRLGAQAPDELDWQEAKEWCDSVGGELPNRQVLLACYLNDDIKAEFAAGDYWSSTEFSATYAWFQYFTNGYHYNGNKAYSLYVRAVKKYAI
jgi:hypothetical protein